MARVVTGVSVEAVTQALKARQEAQEHLDTATQGLSEALREAREAGVPQKELQAATGLSRQRLWQIMEGKR